MIGSIFFFSKPLFNIGISKKNLRDNFFSSKVFFKSELSCHAKNTLHSTSDLRRNTERNTIEFWLITFDIFFILPMIHEDCFNQVSVFCFECKLGCILSFNCLNKLNRKRNKIFLQFRFKIFWKRCHRISLNVLIFIHFKKNLLYLERLEFTLFCPLIKFPFIEKCWFMWSHIFCHYLLIVRLKIHLRSIRNSSPIAKKNLDKKKKIWFFSLDKLILNYWKKAPKHYIL